MHIAVAEPGDIPAWLDLAAGVEDLFGPMLGEPSFHRALEHNIECRTAFCVRYEAGDAGAPLMGGLLFSPRRAPRYRIGWLVVAAPWRRQGVGQALAHHVFKLVHPPAELSVVTFDADIPGGAPARQFYKQLGFGAAEMAPAGPEGGSRQVFRRVFP